MAEKSGAGAPSSHDTTGPGSCSSGCAGARSISKSLSPARSRRRFSATRLEFAESAHQVRAICWSDNTLMRRNDLPANVFLLLRHTGMRIGELPTSPMIASTMLVRIVGRCTCLSAS
jgi:hypothetical protein